jgi:hypothetical protein
MSAVQQYTQPSAYTEEDEQTVNNAFANGQRYLGDDREAAPSSSVGANRNLRSGRGHRAALAHPSTPHAYRGTGGQRGTGVSSEGPRPSQPLDGRAEGRERRDRGTPRA